MIPTYKIPLTLQCHDLVLTAGLCISKVPLEALKATYPDFLHVKEQAYFSTLQYPKRQYSYLLGRYCAKHAISTYMQNNSMTATLIENGVFQQPIVYHSYPTDAQVSISHTNALGAALAFPEAYPMGIDVETMSKAQTATIQTQLTLAEQQKVALLFNDTTTFFTVLWTVKEALSKAFKSGFTIPLDLFEVENIQQKENFLESSFKNFPQYKGISFPLAETICSLVYPKGTQLLFDIAAIQQKMAVNTI